MLENFNKRIVIESAIIGGLGLSIGIALDRGLADQFLPLPTFLHGRISDFFAGIAQASLSRGYCETRTGRITAGFVINSIGEISQRFVPQLGTYDPGDFAAYALGTLTWGIHDYLREKFNYKRSEYYNRNTFC